MRTIISIAIAAACLFTGAAQTDEGWLWDARYSAESVDDSAFADDAHAHTLRVRIGYLWASGTGWSALLEGEHVEPLRDRYNSTANGRTQFPTVADPQATEVNQAWLRWSGDTATVTGGRQRLLFDNQRFIGNVGWRQNEQTYDALHAEASVAGTRLRYAYVDRVHRVFGDGALNPLLRERDHRSQLLNAGWTPAAGQSLTAYSYLLDDRDAAADSSATIGVRWTGTRASFGWAVEAARQREYADQPGTFTLDYFLVEPSFTWRRVKWAAGWERLGGDGTRGFSTPLATLHGFNGWADRFLATPPDGLDDRYLSAGGTALGGDWVVAHRWYSAARGGADYGRESNASFGRPLITGHPVRWLVKYADYREDGFATDVRKVWVQLEWRSK